MTAVKRLTRLDEFKQDNNQYFSKELMQELRIQGFGVYQSSDRITREPEFVEIDNQSHFVVDERLAKKLSVKQVEALAIVKKAESYNSDIVKHSKGSFKDGIKVAGLATAHEILNRKDERHTRRNMLGLGIIAYNLGAGTKIGLNMVDDWCAETNLERLLTNPEFKKTYTDARTIVLEQIQPEIKALEQEKAAAGNEKKAKRAIEKNRKSAEERIKRNSGFTYDR